jgi:hypothetical protein
MALQVSRVTVYASSIEDKPGSLAAKLAALAAAGANLEFVIARRAPEKPGTGVVFIAGLRGSAQTQAATAAGFAGTDSLHSVRAAGPDAPGLGVKITSALADAGINLRGLSAASIGDQCVVYLAVDTADDADKVVQILGGI